MSRTSFAVLVLAALPAAADDAKTPDYYPLAKGHTWEYVGTLNNDKVNVTVTVKAVEVVLGRATATRTLALTKGDETRTSDEEVVVDPNGVLGNPIFDVRTDPPLTLLKFPVKPRDTWSQKSRINGNGREYLAMTTVKEAAEVKVPAGTFTAIPVETGLLFEGEAVGITTWYADGVGMVKLKMTFGANTFEIELKKFTRGK